MFSLTVKCSLDCCNNFVCEVAGIVIKKTVLVNDSARGDRQARLKLGIWIHSDEGLTLETSASESLYGGQFTLSTQLIKPNYLKLGMPVPPTVS